jgi:hypothetical protein
MPQHLIDFIVASGKFDSFGGRSGFEQRADGFGRAQLGPVGVNASFDGELERGPALPVPGIGRRAAGDQFLDHAGPRAPRSDMQSGALLCDAIVAVSFTIESGRAYAYVEQIANARKIPHPREFSEQCSALIDQF